MSEFKLVNTTCTLPFKVDAFCGIDGMKGWMEWQFVIALVGLCTANWINQALPKSWPTSLWFRLAVVVVRLALLGTAVYACVRGFKCPTFKANWGNTGYLLLTPVIALLAGVYAVVMLVKDERKAAKERKLARAAAEAEEEPEGNVEYVQLWKWYPRRRRPTEFSEV